MAAWRVSDPGVFALGGLLLACLSVPVAAATPPSGVAVAVVQQADANGRVLRQDAAVFSGDAIVTGPVGQAQIKFRDNTKLVVGPNSRLVIDAFVYSGNNTARKLSINALKGAFRFISGNSNHDAYNITTPTATIGVRGTEIDVNVSKGVVIYSGAAEVCRRGGGSRNCVMIQGGCALAAFEPNRNVKKVNSIVDRNQTLLQGFQYAVDQRRLRPEFRANTASCGVLRAALPVVPDASKPPPVVVVDNTPPPQPPPSDRCDYYPPHHPPRHWPHRDWPDFHRPDLDHRGDGDGGHHHDRFAGPLGNQQIGLNALTANDPNPDPPARRGFHQLGSQGPNATVDFGSRPSRFGAFGNNRRTWGWNRRGVGGVDNHTPGGIGGNVGGPRGAASTTSNTGGRAGLSSSARGGGGVSTRGGGSTTTSGGNSGGGGHGGGDHGGGGHGGGGGDHGGGGHGGGDHGGGGHGGGGHGGGDHGHRH